MQTTNINADSVNRQDAKRCGNDVKLQGNVMVYITGFARNAETTQVQSQIGSPMSYGFHRLAKNSKAEIETSSV